MKIDKLFTFPISRVLVILGKKSLATIDKNSKDAIGANTKLLLRLMKDNKDTEYGKKYHFADIHSIDDFKKNVPFSTYEDYAPYIDRMIDNNEKDLITVYPIICYSETSGSTGKQKKIPVSKKALQIYAKYTITRVTAIADNYYRKVLKKWMPTGKGLNAIEIETRFVKNGTPSCSISAAASRRFRYGFPFYLTSPGKVLFPIEGMNMTYMKARFLIENKEAQFMISTFMTNIADILSFIKNNWQLLVNDIRNGTIDSRYCSDEAKVYIKRYVRKNKRRANELEALFSSTPFDDHILKKIWPNMSWICAIGTSGFSTYTDRVKTFCGDTIPIDYLTYAASEGMFGICREMNKPEYVLLIDSCFYEFLPVNADKNTKDTLTLDQLQEGQEYEIIITNQSGFYRYRINDVIRVIGHYNTSPIIVFAYRKNQMVNIAGEKMTEEHFKIAIENLGKMLGCNFTNYAIYVDTNVIPSRYVLLLEPDCKIDATKNDEYSQIMEKMLREINPYYVAVKAHSVIGDTYVLILKQHSHALWREMKINAGASSNQVKPVRIIDTQEKYKFFFNQLEAGQKF